MGAQFDSFIRALLLTQEKKCQGQQDIRALFKCTNYTHAFEKNAQFFHIQSWVYYLALYARAGKLLVGASQFHGSSITRYHSVSYFHNSLTW